MKKVLLFATSVTLLLAACKKDTTTAYTSSDSPLLKMMHTMDDSMDAMTMDPDYDFAMMMKQHHLGAVKMAEYELANGTDQIIKTMAQSIKDAQTREIRTLDSFMMAYSPVNMSMAMMDSMHASMHRMASQADAQILKGQTDHDFVHLMIVHHQSAVDMAGAEGMYGKAAFMKNMATMMKTDQTAEITAFKNWLNAGND